MKNLNIISKTRSALSLVLILSFTSFLFSQTPKDALIGKWGLFAKSGGIRGNTETFDTEPKSIIEFTPDHKYKMFDGDSLKMVTSYHFVESKSIFTQKSTSLLKIENSFISQSYSIHGDTLVLSDECYDCFSRSYKRMTPSSAKSKN